WSDEEWREIMGSSNSTFAQRYGRTYGTHQQHPARRELVVLAYLLCSPITIDPLLGPFAIAPIARKVWGAEILDAQVKLLTAVLRKLGYHEKHPVQFIACKRYLLFLNGMPRLES